MEQETNSKSIKILLMRHSESEYNKIAYEWKKENNLPITHPENEDLRFVITPELIDAILTEKGIKQVNKIYSKIRAKKQAQISKTTQSNTLYQVHFVEQF